MTTSPADRDGSGLNSYVKAIRAHPLVVVGLTLIVLGAATGWLAHKGPQYEAQAKVLVTPLPSGNDTFSGLQLLQDSTDPTRVTQTAADLLDTDRAAQGAAHALAGLTPEAVKAEVEVDPVGQSNIVAVIARADIPVDAANLANAFVSAALQNRSERIRRQALAKIRILEQQPSDNGRSQVQRLRMLADGSDPTMSLAEPAMTPSAPVGPPPWLVLVLAGFAGLALGSVASVLMELTDRRIRDVHELLEVFPLPVLTRIPRVSRARLGRGGSALALPPAAREAYRTLQIQLDQPGGVSRVIALVSPSAGDGKTSSAIHLALALAEAQRRVVLIDFDLRKPEVARSLGLPGSRGLDALFAGRARLADVVTYDERHPGLAVASVAPSEGGLVLSPLVRSLPTILDDARALGDYVILDTAPLGEVSDAVPLLPLCDDVVVVARPHNTERQSLEQLRDLLARSGVEPAGMVLVAVGSLRGRYKAYGAAPRRPRFRRPGVRASRAPAGGPSAR